MNIQNEDEKKALLEGVKESGEVAQILNKLKKEKVVVAICANQTALDILDSNKRELESKLKDESDEAMIKTIKSTLEEISKQYEQLAKDVSHAVLVPLKYRDKRTVQTFIQEAMFST